MKALYIYNKEAERERTTIAKARMELPQHVEVVGLDEISSDIRELIRATPALIIIADDDQGECLLAEDGNGQMLVTAKVLKRMDEEDKTIHDAEHNRLDLLINLEKEAAATKVGNALLEDMFERGIL
jgi:hypothetical protein